MGMHHVIIAEMPTERRLPRDSAVVIVIIIIISPIIQLVYRVNIQALSCRTIAD